MVCGIPSLHNAVVLEDELYGKTWVLTFNTNGKRGDFGVPGFFETQELR